MPPKRGPRGAGGGEAILAQYGRAAFRKLSDQLAREASRWAQRIQELEKEAAASGISGPAAFGRRVPEFFSGATESKSKARLQAKFAEWREKQGVPTEEMGLEQLQKFGTHLRSRSEFFRREAEKGSSEKFKDKETREEERTTRAAKDLSSGFDDLTGSAGDLKRLFSSLGRFDIIGTAKSLGGIGERLAGAARAGYGARAEAMVAQGIKLPGGGVMISEEGAAMLPKGGIAGALSSLAGEALPIVGTAAAIAGGAAAVANYTRGQKYGSLALRMEAMAAYGGVPSPEETKAMIAGSPFGAPEAMAGQIAYIEAGGMMTESSKSATAQLIKYKDQLLTAGIGAEEFNTTLGILNRTTNKEIDAKDDLVKLTKRTMIDPKYWARVYAAETGTGEALRGIYAAGGTPLGLIRQAGMLAGTKGFTSGEATQATVSSAQAMTQGLMDSGKMAVMMQMTGMTAQQLFFNLAHGHQDVVMRRMKAGWLGNYGKKVRQFEYAAGGNVPVSPAEELTYADVFAGEMRLGTGWSALLSPTRKGTTTPIDTSKTDKTIDALDAYKTAVKKAGKETDDLFMGFSKLGLGVARLGDAIQGALLKMATINPGPPLTSMQLRQHSYNQLMGGPLAPGASNPGKPH